MPSIVLFTAACLHDNINQMARQLGQALGRRGFAVAEVDLRQPDCTGRLLSLLGSGTVTLAISFTGFGLDRRRDGNIFTAAAVPLLSIYLDPLLLYWDQVELALPGRVVTSTAPSDIGFCQRFAPTIATAFLPHSAPVLPVRPWAERDIPIFFSGSIPQRPETLRATWRQWGAAVEQRLNSMLDACLAEPHQPLSDTIAKVGAQTGLPLDTPLKLHPYFDTLDRYMRVALRWQGITALLTQPITVAGSGWDSLAAKPGRARFIGPQPITATLDLTSRAQVAINLCTPWHGSHERIFHAMSAGTAMVSSWTGYLATARFRDAIRLSAPGDMAQQVADLLGGNQAEALASLGAAAFRAGETWDHRAETVLTLMGLATP